MRILGLYSEDYPWDVRIEKILGGLTGRGHSVDLVCRNLERKASNETVSGMPETTAQPPPPSYSAGSLFAP